MHVVFFFLIMKLRMINRGKKVDLSCCLSLSKAFTFIVNVVDANVRLSNAQFALCRLRVLCADRSL